MIAASSFGTCAISDGKLYCWGYNANLQAGQGGSSTADIRSPSQVGVSNLVNVRKVLSNYAAHHVCAIDETSNNNYNLKCWGNNNRYQLGLGNTGNLSTPTIITVGSSGNDIADVSMNLDATCATKTNGDLYCWGTNYSGFMGIGAPTTYPRFTTPRLLFNLL
jgi:alpha-tubulin suppressor-like RCC1 family protein